MFVYFQNLSIAVPLKFVKYVKLFGTFEDTISKCPNIIRKKHVSQLLGCLLARVRSSNFWSIIMEHPILYLLVYFLRKIVIIFSKMKCFSQIFPDTSHIDRQQRISSRADETVHVPFLARFVHNYYDAWPLPHHGFKKIYL